VADEDAHWSLEYVAGRLAALALPRHRSDPHGGWEETVLALAIDAAKWKATRDKVPIPDILLDPRLRVPELSYEMQHIQRRWFDEAGSSDAVGAYLPAIARALGD